LLVSRRPLISILFFFALGLVWGTVWPTVWIFLAALLLCAVIVTLTTPVSCALMPGLYCAVMLLAMGYSWLRAEPMGRAEEKRQHTLTVISKAKFITRYRTLYRALLHMEGRSKNPLVNLVLDGAPTFSLRRGERVRAFARIDRFGVTVWQLKANWKRCQKIPPGPSVASLQALQRAFKKSFVRLPRLHRGLLSSMLLGDRTEVDSNTKRLFQRTGTAHLLAISGLHVSLVAGLIFLLLRLSMVRPSFQILAAMAAIWFYITLVGGPPSSVRAGLLLTSYLFARLFGLSTDPWNLLAFTGLVLIVWDPDLIYNVGTQLSFATFSGIVFCSPYLKSSSTELFPSLPRLSRFLLWLRGSLCVTAAAFVGGSPVVIYHFGLLQPTGLIANLPALPIFSLLLTVSLLGTLLGLIHPLLAWPFIELAGLLSSLLLQVLGWMDGLLPSIKAIDLGHFSLLLPVLIALCSLCIFRGRGKLASIVAAVIFCCLSSTPATRPLRFRRGEDFVQSLPNLKTGQSVKLHFEGGRVFWLTDHGRQLIKLKQQRWSKGTWFSGPLTIHRLERGLLRIVVGDQSVLWLRRHRRRTLQYFQHHSIASDDVLLVQCWLPEPIFQAMSRTWAGSVIVYQGTFSSSLKASTIFHERQLTIEFGSSITVKRLEKTQ
jgi:ComEC/Rec2-related protein